MTKYEQLKIYAAYLPHKLKGKRTDGAKGDYILRAIYDDGSMIWKYDGFGNSKQIGVKPILYDLSWLTEDEFNFIWENETDSDTIDKFISLDCETRLSWKFSYGFWQELFKNHFNVFDIPAGEFIPKETLKTESND